TMAKWHEGYLDPQYCAWGFFPLGLSVEHGVLMPNPENPEEMQNVVGIDLTKSQKKLASKNGIKVSEKVEGTPQVFIGGGTGGGKSLHVNTWVPVLIDEHD